MWLIESYCVEPLRVFILFVKQNPKKVLSINYDVANLKNNIMTIVSIEGIWFSFKIYMFHDVLT